MSVHEYEATFIVNPTLSEEDTVRVAERVTQIISARGGAVSDVSPWGKRRLAYPINHLREGSYVTVTFDMDSVRENELENAINLVEPVIRHLVVRVNETQKARAQRARAAAQRSAGAQQAQVQQQPSQPVPVAVASAAETDSVDAGMADDVPLAEAGAGSAEEAVTADVADEEE